MQILEIIDGEAVARDATPEELADLYPAVDMAALKDTALARTYADVDKVTFDAVGNRVEEYKDAEAAARAYVAAGYTGDADSDISSYARHNPTGMEQTSQWAADQIIARADAFRAAQKAMRAKRFECQAAMRAATAPEGLAMAVQDWDGFITQTRADLGL
jgi:hypothetical protein